MFIMGERLCLAVKFKQPTTSGTNPNDSRAVCMESAYFIMTQAVWNGRNGSIMEKRLPPAIKNIDASICR